MSTRMMPYDDPYYDNLHYDDPNYDDPHNFDPYYELTELYDYNPVESPYDDPYELISTDSEDGMIHIGRKDGSPCDIDAQDLEDAIFYNCDNYQREGTRQIRIAIEGDIRLHGDASKLFAPNRKLGENRPPYTFDESLGRLKTTNVTSIAELSEYNIVSTGSQSDPEERVIRIGWRDGSPCDLDAWKLRRAILDACDEAGYEREGGPVRIVFNGDVRLHGDASKLFSPRGKLGENGPSYTFDESLRRLKTTDVTNMSQMFAHCDKAEQIDVSGFDTSNVTDMSEMFSGCESLKSLDVSGFDMSNVRELSDRFANCKSLKDLKVTGFNTVREFYMARDLASTAMQDALSTISTNARTYAPEPDPMVPAPDMPAPEMPVTEKNSEPRHNTGDFGD